MSAPPPANAPARPAPSPPPPAVLIHARRWVLASFTALIVLGAAWEFWLAPLRPGGSMLALKVLPLVLSLPALRASRLRVYQAWSMGILLYLCEGLVRAASDTGLSANLAVIETVLAAVAFVALLLYSRGRRLQAQTAR
ncbi:MAG: DUF2069 domain-containing protein [Burkholderiaceae bacterium]|nr:DUF2069 domain-containing protein [Burkholderiaceae bacterium]